LKILAFIPARSNSKGIPHKNIVPINSIPLIGYTIQSARDSKYVNKILVSTDSQKIANIAKKFGAESPFLRPKKLSTDTTTGYSVLLHTLNFLKSKSYIPDIITFLQPTSPTRTAKMIDDSINLLKRSKATSVVSVHKIIDQSYSSFSTNNTFLKPIKKNFEKYSRRQDKPFFYYPTGSIYTFWFDNIEKYHSIYGPRIKPQVVTDPSLKIDIDSLFDLFVAEMTIKHWKKFSKKHSTNSSN